MTRRPRRIQGRGRIDAAALSYDRAGTLVARRGFEHGIIYASAFIPAAAADRYIARLDVTTPGSATGKPHQDAAPIENADNEQRD